MRVITDLLKIKINHLGCLAILQSEDILIEQAASY